MADEKPTDGSTKQWDKLQRMRQASGTALTKPDGTPNDAAATPGSEQRATAEEIKAEQERLQAGEPVGGDTADDDTDTDDVEEETPEEPEKVVVAAHERTKPKPKEPEEKAPAGTEWVEIDGNRIAVDAALAAAYRDSTAALATETQNADRQQLVDDIVTRVTEKLPKPEAATPPNPADVAVKAAVAAIDAEPWQHPMPTSKQQLENQDEYDKQLEAHIDEKADRKARKAVAEKEARDAAAANANRADAARQQEAWAREQLGIQFYRQFKVLDDPDIKPLVDVLLNKKFDEVVASGAVNKPLPPKEVEAMKMRAFNDVATAATRQIVKLRGKTGAAAAPAPEPPKVVTGSPNKGPARAPKAPPEKAREKFPSGSVSAMLAKHKASKQDGKPAA